MESLDQRSRLVILFLYLAALFVASKLALDSWYPPSTEQGLWFFAGLATLLLGNLLVTPFFTAPADAISYAVSGLVALLAVDVFGDSDGSTEVLAIALTAYMVSVIVVGIGAILLRGFSGTMGSSLAHDLFRLAHVYGNARAVYSAIFLFSLLAYHKEDATEFAILFVAGVLVVTVQPLEYGAIWLNRTVKALRGLVPAVQVGDLLARQEPGVMLVRRTPGAPLNPGDLVVVRTADDDVLLGLHLDWQWLAGETWARIVRLVEAVLTTDERQRLGRHVSSVGAVARISDDAADQDILGKLHRVAVVANRRSLVGIVAPDTSLRSLVFEVTSTETAIEEGRLVETRIRDQSVLFQVIDGVSQEEILQQLNRYGYARAKARKVGVWDSDRERFQPVRWIPLVNEPVLLVSEQAPPEDARAVGFFPGTAYPVLLNPTQLVTHNTAILGILGVGKTTLTFELINRIAREGIKVICLDITDEYARELRCVSTTHRLHQINVKCSTGKTNFKQNKEEGGSVNDFKALIRKCLSSYLSQWLSPGTDEVLVIDPSSFDVWQQETNLFQGTAAMSSLTPTQITRIITEETLALVQALGPANRARVCIVYEEAHSLVPEWNSAAFPGDQPAANGTAKAILQGRKYGLGCLLITQRTANVTKSILNQCNTIIAMRVYDSTGIEYLRNYIGDDFASVLSTMEDRHAIVFGKASSCLDPVLVRLNDRDDFLRIFTRR